MGTCWGRVHGSDSQRCWAHDPAKRPRFREIHAECEALYLQREYYSTTVYWRRTLTLTLNKNSQTRLGMLVGARMTLHRGSCAGGMNVRVRRCAARCNGVRVHEPSCVGAWVYV